MRLKDPLFLLLLIFWVPMILVYFFRERTSRAAVRFSDLSIVKNLPKSALVRSRHALLFLELLGLGLLAVALARPQMGRSTSEVTTEGVDIMLILDISESMQALDFKPENRLTVAKNTIQEFIKKRESD
ncbi:MAG: BatA domain-containing protein, partial [Chitinispirillaceae bacterium]|nr:BatA domain-containing protein [Chitinispirillaceae bacterium]